MAHGHHTAHLDPPAKLRLPDGFGSIAIGMIVLGVLAFGYGLAADPIRAWKSYLIGFTFTALLGASGPFLVAALYLTRAGWGITLRRIPEAFGAWLLPAGALGLILAIGGAHTLYEWTDLELMASDPLLSAKAPFLNWPQMIISTIIAFGGIGGFAGWMAHNSRKQDKTGERSLTLLNARLASIFMVVFALGVSLIGINFIMSLHPHWFSTMWAVNIWSTMVQAGFALITIIALLLYRKRMLDGFLNENHIHDIGKLTFASTAFWAYIAFCQFLLMWYSNLPEEFLFWHARYVDGWGTYTLILPLFKFVIPFALMLPRAVKRGKGLIPICVWILAASVFEIYWWVAPAPAAHEHHFHPTLPWMELAVVIGFFGGFMLVVGKTLAKHNLVPLKDPRLNEALHHHQ